MTPCNLTFCICYSTCEYTPSSWVFLFLSILCSLFCPLIPLTHTHNTHLFRYTRIIPNSSQTWTRTIMWSSQAINCIEVQNLKQNYCVELISNCCIEFTRNHWIEVLGIKVHSRHHVQIFKIKQKPSYRAHPQPIDLSSLKTILSLKVHSNHHVQIFWN